MLSKIGLNHYTAINIEFNGQVIGRRKDSSSSIDSVQLQRNIAALLNRQDVDSNTISLKNQNADSAFKDQVHVPDTLKSILADHNLSNTKKTNRSNPQEQPKKNTAVAIKRPKALMKKLE